MNHWTGYLRNRLGAIFNPNRGSGQTGDTPRRMLFASLEIAPEREATGQAGVRRDLLLSVLCTGLLGVPLYLWEIKYMAWSGVDWWLAFYPASRLLLHGLNPYQIANFHNPVWALLPLLPFALTGKAIGGIAIFFVNLFSFVFVTLRLGGKFPAVLVLVLSPLMIYELYFDNIDWLVLWGFLLPPPIGLFFLALKPQISIGVVIYWAYAAWRRGGWRAVAGTFAPVVIALIASVLFFGNWMKPTSDRLITGFYNMSAFPWSVPIGILVLYLAIRRERMNTAISASPFLSPYLNMGSWTTILVGAADSVPVTTALFVCTWLLFATKAIIPLLR